MTDENARLWTYTESIDPETAPVTYEAMSRLEAAYQRTEREFEEATRRGDPDASSTRHVQQIRLWGWESTLVLADVLAKLEQRLPKPE